VGETFTLRFTATLVNGRAGLPQYGLDAGDLELLSDRTVDANQFGSEAAFTVRADEPGSYPVALGVTFEKGSPYLDGGCCVWGFTSDRSPTFEVIVAGDGETIASPTPTATAIPTPTEIQEVGDILLCPGDCNGDFRVEIAELVRGVAIALGNSLVGECPIFGDSSVSELVAAVRSALDGCNATARLVPASTPIPVNCRDCCADCRDAQCVADCVGKDPCVLTAEWHGTVREQGSGDPIAGAMITLNGASAVSSADGSYRVRAERLEVCTGLDYLYEFSVKADGFVSLVEQLYRVPFPVKSERAVAMQPSTSPSALADGPGWISPPLKAGRLF
jgi:hypothetical protein